MPFEVGETVVHPRHSATTITKPLLYQVTEGQTNWSRRYETGEQKASTVLDEVFAS